MTYQLEVKGFDRKPGSSEEEEIRTLIERRISSLNKRLKALAPDQIFLRVLVKRVPPHQTYDVSVTLEVPGKTLPAKEQNSSLPSAVSAAFAEIERQLEAYLASRRGEQDWKRIARREELRR